MKVCGLTGGVGMGKSTVAGFLRNRGAQVVDADDLARQLVQPGQPALAEIQAAFGKAILAPDGRLRRDELARIIFADAAARKNSKPSSILASANAGSPRSKRGAGKTARSPSW